MKGEFLGKGTYATVRATTLNGIDVAVKCFDAPQRYINPLDIIFITTQIRKKDLQLDFVRELSALQVLKGHPNIVQILQYKIEGLFFCI